MSSTSPGPWVEQWLSPPRFGVYLTAADSDRARALALYEWNTAMSAAVLHDLAHVEIALRNAYDRALTTHAPPGAPHWTADPWTYFPAVTRRAANGALHDANERPREQITRARSGAGRTAPPGKVIAELTFGFWRYLSTSAHEVPLWRPYLHHGFLPGTSRRAVDGPMVRLHKLRNRVAHHEPLLAQNLTQGYEDTRALAGLISPDLQAYVESVTSWPPTQQQRP